MTTPICQRTITCALPGHCRTCRTPFHIGADIGRGPDGWLCLTCTKVRNDVDRIADWLSYYFATARTPPPLTVLDVDVLIAELTEQPTTDGAALIEALPSLIGQRLRAPIILDLLRGLGR